MKIQTIMLLIITVNKIDFIKAQRRSASDYGLQDYELKGLKNLMMTRLRRRKDILHGDQLKFKKDRENIWFCGVIPYIFDAGFTPESARNLRELMQTFNNRTCIKFRQYRPKADVEWLYITNNCSKTCRVNRGRVKNGENHANFADSCILDIPLALHNLMHILGFYDQQQYPNRDNYVTVLWDNIKPEGLEHFKIQKEMTDFSMPYDYHSVTHVRSMDWMKQNDIVLESKIKQVALGPQNNKLSFQDVEKINIFYEWECSIRYYKEFFMETDL